MQKDLRNIIIAGALTGMAGYVDAAGFIATGGFFLSFMSGNSTRAGVGLAQISQTALIALDLITCFVAGVVAGTLIGRFAAKYRASAILATIALCLGIGILFGQNGQLLAAISLIAFAMGAENLIFEDKGEVRFGLTYMTGTLVKVGQRIAWALSGGPRWDWLRYLVLWLSMLLGGGLGALVYTRINFNALWLPVALALYLAWLLRSRNRRLTD